jgi:hypothetical protein
MPQATETRTVHSLLTVLKGAAGPAFVIGGFQLMPTYYLFGAICVYFGIAIVLVEILLEPFLQAKPRKVKVVLFALPLVAFGLFTKVVVLAAARIDCEAYAINVPHFTGDDFGGIKWTDKQIDLRVWIRNPTTTPYENVDIVVDTNAILGGAGQLQKIPTCTVGLSNEFEGHLTMIDSAGAKHLIHPPIGTTLGVGYRIMCDKFPPLSAIQLILATSTDFSGYSGLSLDVKNEPNLGIGNTRPTIATVKGTYISRFRTRSINETIDVSVR